MTFALKGVLGLKDSFQYFYIIYFVQLDINRIKPLSVKSLFMDFMMSLIHIMKAILTDIGQTMTEHNQWNVLFRCDFIIYKIVNNSLNMTYSLKQNQSIY